VRSAIGLGSMLCAFWALGHLPLAQAVSLSYSTPLFVTIAAVLWLGETVRVRRWAAVVVGFIGVLVIVRPGTAGFTAGSLVAVAAAVLSSLVAIQIKQLTRVDSADTVVLYTYVFWVPLSLVPALFVWVWPTGMAWLWLLATGVLGTVGQLLWTRAAAGRSLGADPDQLPAAAAGNAVRLAAVQRKRGPLDDHRCRHHPRRQRLHRPPRSRAVAPRRKRGRLRRSQARRAGPL
jgi:hypothetical protein